MKIARVRIRSVTMRGEAVIGSFLSYRMVPAIENGKDTIAKFLPVSLNRGGLITAKKWLRI